MMSPTLVKSLIGVVVAGASVAGGYGIYSHLSSPQTLGDLLISQGFTLLDVDGTSDDSLWDSNVTSHKSANSPTPKLFGYSEDTEGSDTNQQATNNRNKMKVSCKHLLRSPSSATSRLDEVKKWCTKPISQPSAA